MGNIRKCIFTGKKSDFYKTISHKDNHNWARKIPCTKEWLNSKGNNFNNLTKKEFRLVELFYEKELALLKADNIEKEMEKIREDISKNKPEDVASILIIEENNLTKEEDCNNIKKENIWD